MTSMQPWSTNLQSQIKGFQFEHLYILVFFPSLFQWVVGCVSPNVPFVRIINTHAKLLRACFHAPADHEAVSWLKDMKRTRHGGVSHGAHKDRHILRQAVEKKTCRLDFSHFWPSFAVGTCWHQSLTRRALSSRPREFSSSLRSPDSNTAWSTCPRGSSPWTFCMLDTGESKSFPIN